MKADKASFLGFCGRKRKIIGRAGSNICPQEVEQGPREHAAIVHAGAVGALPDARLEREGLYDTQRWGSTTKHHRQYPVWPSLVWL
jgi:non-ribosomal peptide synthetase component E (peptide arylation enzyme)